MIRFCVIAVCLVACLVGCDLTRAEADRIRTGAGDVGSFFGVPRGLVEGVTGVALYAFAHVHGKRRGRRAERACSTTAKTSAPKPSKTGT